MDTILVGIICGMLFAWAFTATCYEQSYKTDCEAVGVIKIGTNYYNCSPKPIK